MSNAKQASERKIRDMLQKYDEEFDGNVWFVQGNPVISHKALERIAAKAEIEFDKPQILRAERDEAVILVFGHIVAANSPTGKTGHEWSIGEALVNTNYRVSGNQAAYVWAMAEKRAKDRVILKLVNLHGLLYSEEESDDFSQRQQPAAKPVDPPRNENKPADGSYKTPGGFDRKPGERLSADDAPIILDVLLKAMDMAGTPDVLNAWVVKQKSQIDSLPDTEFDTFKVSYRNYLAELKRAA